MVLAAYTMLASSHKSFPFEEGGDVVVDRDNRSTVTGLREYRSRCSVDASRAVREEVWARLATDLKPRYIDEIVTREITLDELPEHFQGYIDAAVTGRTLVRIGA